MVLLCVFSINLRFRFRLQDQVQVLYTTGSLISSVAVTVAPVGTQDLGQTAQGQAVRECVCSYSG